MDKRIDIPDLFRLEQEAANKYREQINRKDLSVGGIVLIYDGDHIFDAICGPFRIEITENSLEDISDMMEIFEEEKRLIVNIRDQKGLSKLLGLVLKPGNYLIDAIEDN
jgi:hypothetical protein